MKSRIALLLVACAASLSIASAAFAFDYMLPLLQGSGLSHCTSGPVCDRYQTIPLEEVGGGIAYGNVDIYYGLLASEANPVKPVLFYATPLDHNGVATGAPVACLPVAPYTDYQGRAWYDTRRCQMGPHLPNTTRMVELQFRLTFGANYSGQKEWFEIRKSGAGAAETLTSNQTRVVTFP